MNNLLKPDAFYNRVELDAAVLGELYGSDTQHMEMVFAAFLSEAGACAHVLQQSYRHRNLALLKSTVHKFKPLFYYVGLTALHRQFDAFEMLCGSAATTAAVATPYRRLIEDMQQGIQLIEQECERLKNFNALLQ